MNKNTKSKVISALWLGLGVGFGFAVFTPLINMAKQKMGVNL